jgi:hypothetical protein
MMTVYSGPVFDMAVNQFGAIANHLEIPLDERDRILMPKRAITVSCPVAVFAKADDSPHRTATMVIGVKKVRAARNTRGVFP